MTYEFAPNNMSPAEQAFAAAKDAFRMTMMDCDPFADLVMAHISDPRQRMPADLPDFTCDPWRYKDDTGEPNGYGIRLSFSETAHDDGQSLTFTAYDYIKVASVTNKELLGDALLEDIEDRQPDVTDAEERARAIVSSFLPAYNNFVNMEIPGDQLAIDPMSGAFGLASDIDNRAHPIE